jgi:hypothetical protein
VSTEYCPNLDADSGQSNIPPFETKDMDTRCPSSGLFRYHRLLTFLLEVRNWVFFFYFTGKPASSVDQQCMQRKQSHAGCLRNYRLPVIVVNKDRYDDLLDKELHLSLD